MLGRRNRRQKRPKSSTVLSDRRRHGGSVCGDDPAEAADPAMAQERADGPKDQFIMDTSKRLLSHAVFTAGQSGWLDAIDAAIELKPDSWNGYTIGDNMHKDTSRYPRRMEIAAMRNSSKRHQECLRPQRAVSAVDRKIVSKPARLCRRQRRRSGCERLAEAYLRRLSLGLSLRWRGRRRADAKSRTGLLGNRCVVDRLAAMADRGAAPPRNPRRHAAQAWLHAPGRPDRSVKTAIFSGNNARLYNIEVKKSERSWLMTSSQL